MIDPPRQDIDLADADLLTELQQSTPEAVRSSRAHTRLTVRSKVTVQPGNMSERRSLRVQGVTGDVSAGGCQLLVPVPLLVGDIYLVSFDRSAIDLSPVYARCMRCRVIREDAYEVGFAFFSPVDIAAASPRSADSEGSLI